MNEDKLNTIKKQLAENNLDAVFISNVSNIIYLTGFSNFSQIEREAFIFITKDHQYIITDGRYSEAVLAQVPIFQLAEISLKSLFPKLIEKLAKKHKVKKVGVEEDNLTFSEHQKLSKHFEHLENFSVHQNRLVKTTAEIKLVEKACQIGDLAFKHILKKIKVGITENEIADELISFFKKHQSIFSFDPIVAFGPHSSVPHHQTGNSKLSDESGQFILIDTGAKFENYCSDMTRAFFFGKASPKQKKIYQAVSGAQQKAIEYINKTQSLGKDVKASMTDKIAQDFIKKSGFTPYSHGLGHGIGLEVHESPHLSIKSKEILTPGMVFSIEPGIYIPDFGGVRIEDLFVLEESGLRQLTTSSKEIIEL